MVDQANNVTMSPILRFRTRGVGDVTPPRIVGAVIPVEVGVDRAVLAWSTDEGAYSKILYGTSRNALDQSQASVANVLLLDHRVELTGLTPSTKYWYTAVSLDAALSEGRSDTLSLTTRAGNDVTPPPILPPAPGGINKGLVLRAAPRYGISQTRAQWSSSEENSGRVEVTTDSTRGPDSLFADRSIVRTYNAPDYAREQKVNLAGLDLAAPYWAMIVIRDRAGNVSKGIPIEFATPTATDLDVTPPSITFSNIVPTRIPSWPPDAVEVQFQLVLSEPAAVELSYGRAPDTLSNLAVSLRKEPSHTIRGPCVVRDPVLLPASDQRRGGQCLRGPRAALVQDACTGPGFPSAIHTFSDHRFDLRQCLRWPGGGHRRVQHERSFHVRSVRARSWRRGRRAVCGYAVQTFQEPQNQQPQVGHAVRIRPCPDR